MIVAALMLILAGSLTGAAVLWIQGASFWGIVLGYVGGGWAGLLVGLPLALLLQRMHRRSDGNRTPRPARHSPARRRA